jgi:hypothetical protein
MPCSILPPHPPRIMAPTAAATVAQQPSVCIDRWLPITHSNKTKATQSTISRNLVLSQLPVSHAAAASSKATTGTTSASAPLDPPSRGVGRSGECVGSPQTRPDRHCDNKRNLRLPFRGYLHSSPLRGIVCLARGLAAQAALRAVRLPEKRRVYSKRPPSSFPGSQLDARGCARADQSPPARTCLLLTPNDPDARSASRTDRRPGR